MDKRQIDINSFGPFDTSTKRELDEITELASIFFDAPISLIALLDNKRQWFISKKGVDLNETPIEDSFCQHTLHKPDQVLIVENALNDERFVSNKLVLNDPNIRFYAGAPLVTQSNNVLGTLCVIDVKPRCFSKEQERALKILARKAMGKIESFKLINSLTRSKVFNAKRLINLTENLPIGLFELEVALNGAMNFNFLSKGITKLHPEIRIEDWMKDAKVGFTVMHPDDIEFFQRAMNTSITSEKQLYHEYRVKHYTGYRWHAINATPVKQDSGNTILYGSFTDVTHHYEYESSLEQMSFDISHILRRPVTNLLGIIDLIQGEEHLSQDKVMEYVGHISTISNELDQYTRQLNKTYSEKSIKVSSLNLT